MAEELALESNQKPLPKVSCLMVTADRIRFFKRALRSYLNQTYKNRELIILDDGKEDLEPLLKDAPPGEVIYLKIPKTPGNLLGHLRNMTLEKASGDFICQWDDDDWYHPSRIQTQVDVLLKGYDACCLSNTLMHIDQEPFFHHPYVSYFRRGTPGSIMHHRNETIRYPAMRRSEDDIYLMEWEKKRYFKLPRSYSHLFIRCFHGANTWDMKHFLEQMRNTVPDLTAYYWYKYIRKDLFQHSRFRLDETAQAAFENYLEDSFQTGVFCR